MKRALAAAALGLAACGTNSITISSGEFNAPVGLAATSAGEMAMGIARRTRGAPEGWAGSSTCTSTSGLRMVAQSVVKAPLASGSASRICVVSTLSTSV